MRAPALGRRTLRLLGAASLFVVLLLIVAEGALQVGAVFARDRAVWRPDASRRVLCVGDSHTFGALVPAEESYPGHLQRLLDEQAPGIYSVVNLGIPGMNTAQVLDQLRAGLRRYRPDLVIVWCGVNNAWNRAESAADPSARRFSLARTLGRLRLYRLIRVWLHDRSLERALASLGPQQRYELTDHAGAEAPGRRLTAVMDDRAEQMEFTDSGFRVDAEMEQRAAADYRRMGEESRAAGIAVVFVTYPVERGAFSLANDAVRRTAAELGATVVESSRATRRIPLERRQLLWAGHPNGPMYAEIARDLVPVVLRGGGAEPVAGASTRLTFEPGTSDAGAGTLTEVSAVFGPCTGTTAGCATGTGCYRWNPHGEPCNVRKRLPKSGGRLRASVRLRVDADPRGDHEVFGVVEDVYGSGVYLQLTSARQLRLVSLGSRSRHGSCGPLAARLAPDVWYGVRMVVEKSDSATLVLELTDQEGAVLDSATCADQPAGGGSFTELIVGSSNPLATSADVRFDDVEVREVVS